MRGDGNKFVSGKEILSEARSRNLTLMKDNRDVIVIGIKTVII